MSGFNLRTVDPYQVLFPLGILHALVGTSVWILFALRFTTYPGQSHPHHMIGGFLFSFAAGFMMTAIPKFTGSAPSSRRELFLATLLSVGSLLFSTPLLTLGMLIFISIFFVRRFLARSFSPPPHFLFLPIGLCLGILGATLLFLVETKSISSSYANAGKLCLYYGTMLSFLLGIGAKLISALLGWAAPPTHRIEPAQAAKNTRKIFLTKWSSAALQATLFLTGFWVEIELNPSLGRGLRAVCATWIAMQSWRLYRLPRAPGKLPFWIWVAAWILLLGLWTHTLFPALGVHAAHLVFIGGFGLMTLLIASRVVLAHGGYSLELESKSRIYATAAILVLAAAATRVVSLWTSSLYQHFAYAAALWILAVMLWSAFFLPKMLRGILVRAE